MHGVMDDEPLLGPLPFSWRVQRVRFNISDLGGYSTRYWNSETNSSTTEDPRLGSLPFPWERVNRSKTTADPLTVAPHRNKLTGEEVNWDPRMSPEALRARGVKLETFNLV
jgi:hypothetical protein